MAAFKTSSHVITQLTHQNISCPFLGKVTRQDKFEVLFLGNITACLREHISIELLLLFLTYQNAS